MSKKYGWIIPAVLLTLGFSVFFIAAFDDASAQGGGYPTRPRFDAVGIGVNAPTTNGQQSILGTTPVLDLVESDASANNGRYRFNISAEQLQAQACTDGLTCAPFMNVMRTGNTIDQIDFTTTNFLVNGAPIGGSPAGADTQVQFNNAGAFGADSSFTFTSATDTVGVNRITAVKAGGGDGAAFLVRNNGAAAFGWYEEDAAVDNKSWDLIVNGEQLIGRAVNDANSAASSWLTIDRTGTTIDLINLTGTSVQANGATIATQESSSFTLTATSGFTTTPSGTVQYVRSGNIGCLAFNAAISGTSNATGMNFSGIPASIRPLTVARLVRVYSLQDNSAGQKTGVAEITAAGALNFGLETVSGSNIIGGGNFTTSGTKGIQAETSFCWPIN